MARLIASSLTSFQVVASKSGQDLNGHASGRRLSPGALSPAHAGQEQRGEKADGQLLQACSTQLTSALYATPSKSSTIT